MSLILALLCMATGGFVNANTAVDPERQVLPLRTLNGWIVDADDNIGGISDKRKISKPAKVDYDDVLAATDEIKELKSKKIDPNSAEGKALRVAATRAVTQACEVVRRSKGHCGIWKVVRHKDGRVIPDVTADVKARF